MRNDPVRVAYARCASYADRRILKESIEKALAVQLEDFGGVSGKKIMLKPNLLAWRRKEDIACVHPAFVVESARAFLDAGASEVAIIENPAVQTAPAIIKSMGIAGELAAMNVKVANFERFAKISPPENVRFKNIEAAQEYLEFDAVCDIAKAKTHGMMKLTLCVKNLFGLVKGSERMGWHLAVGRDFAMFADMLLDIYLTVRPQFNLLDAITCMESGGTRFHCRRVGFAGAGFFCCAAPGGGRSSDPEKCGAPRIACPFCKYGRCSRTESFSSAGPSGNADGVGSVPAAVPQGMAPELCDIEAAS